MSDNTIIKSGDSFQKEDKHTDKIKYFIQSIPTIYILVVIIFTISYVYIEHRLDTLDEKIKTMFSVNDKKIDTQRNYLKEIINLRHE